VTRPVYLDVWKLDVTPTAKLLAVRIEAYQGREGWCFASSSRLGAEIGVTGDTVRAALVELRERGCLEEEGKPGRPTQRRLTRGRADTATRERADTPPVSIHPRNLCPPGPPKRKKRAAGATPAPPGGAPSREVTWLD
jgi:DNA-binding transcriptional MocR family regulator